MVDGLTMQLAVHMVRSWSNRRSHHLDRSPQGPCDWRIRRAMERLEAGFAEDIGLAELAILADLSPRHLTELFRAATGLPPHQWLMRRRVERAREMLGNPKLSVTEIAHACGFASSQHLATVFKKQVSITPTEYRRDRLL